MGEIAESLINGEFCNTCGAYIGESVGYPRSCCENLPYNNLEEYIRYVDDYRNGRVDFYGKVIKNEEPETKRKAVGKFTDSTKMPFGKFKGQKLANVPADYLIWLHKEGKCFTDLKNYIHENLDVLNKEAKKKR